jgi:hypothetical protein
MLYLPHRRLHCRASAAVSRHGDITAAEDAAISGGALLLDGAGDYAYYADNADWDLSGQFCLEGWLSWASTSGNPGLITHGGALDSGGESGWSLFGGSSGYLYFYVYNADDDEYCVPYWSVGTISTSTFHHVAVYRDSSNVIRLAFDGTVNGTTETNSGAFNFGSAQLRLGCRKDSSRYFNGSMKHIRLSNVARYGASNFTPASSFTADANTLLYLPLTANLTDQAAA